MFGITPPDGTGNQPALGTSGNTAAAAAAANPTTTYNSYNNNSFSLYEWLAGSATTSHATNVKRS